MSLELLKNRKFNLIINKFHQKHQKEILDVILFGSTIKGKEKPGDTDILLLFKEKENLDIAYELKKQLKNTQIITKTYPRLFDKNFQARESYLSEGYSLIRKQFISRGLGYSNLILFKYELKGFSQSKRMQLQYALYGRDKKSGIVNKLSLNKFADTIFLCPTENSEKLKEFFEHWEINFKIFPVLIPQRILT